MDEKISDDVPMTPADHRLAYALTIAVCAVHTDGGARAAMFHDELVRAWRQSQSRNTHVLRLHDAAGHLIKASPGSGELIWARARASQALSRFAEWRLGVALERSREPEVAA